jgi:signal peptidase II
MSDKQSRLRQVILFLSTAAVVVGLDQLTKSWIENSTIPLGGSVPTSGFFRITHIHNTGAAFGIFQDATAILAVISAIGAMVIIWLGIFMSRRISFLSSTSSMLILGIILGGTIGNFLDRAFIGYVTDFLKMGTFPDYNIADSAMVVGGILLAYKLIRSSSAEVPDGTNDSPCG